MSERNRKRNGDNYINPFWLILSVMFIFIGIIAVIFEIVEDWGEKETVGTEEANVRKVDVAKTKDIMLIFI